MLAKNAESSLAGLGCRLIRQPRQPINSETEFAKASQGPADEFIVRVCDVRAGWRPKGLTTQPHTDLLYI